MSGEDTMRPPVSLRRVHEALLGAAACLEPLLPLANSCMVSFITEDQWRRLVPGPLAAALLQLPAEQLLRLPAAAPDQLPAGPLRQLAEQLGRHRLSGCGVLSPPPPVSAAALPLMDQFFSDKKLHEVDRMAATVAHLAATGGVGQVVDLGSGKGYLSSMLALQHGLDVLAVEANEVHSHGAQKVNANIKKSWDAIVSRSAALQIGQQPERRSRKWKRQQRSQDRSRHRPAPGRLTPVDQLVTSGTHLSELVALHGDGYRPVAVVGLHTCGDLAVNSIRMFNEMPQASLLVNVGCCYHLQRERFEGQFWADLDLQEVSFPLSRPLLERRFALGQQARGLAAQASERIASYQRAPSPFLYYRAVLQVFLQDRLGTVPTDIMVGRLARKARDYLDYMHMALSKYPLDHRDSIEAAHLVQLFDPVTSPRCYALIATKRSGAVDEKSHGKGGKEPTAVSADSTVGCSDSADSAEPTTVTVEARTAQT
ncbi:methyltransferase-like protein 25 isoform X1 [Amphibalanus amphitrite]|uniref:methyltransferase-like protein 25 isoform X1 n=1 Tax=Amphibalanus amphitrite TaxID=1232801 RepID=UPI001C908CA9|nr:methyltransferase-like protein 25 isoform X1 [Amphibalanus amphitrite]